MLYTRGMRDVIIREAVEGDLDAVAVLAARLVRLHHAWDPRRYLLEEPVEQGYRWWLGSQLGEPEVVLLVAERAGQVVGYVYGAVEPRDWAMLLERHGAIHDVYVDEAHRGQGLARALLEGALQRLGARAENVVLHTAVQNEAAQRLFARLGFRPTMVEMTRSGAAAQPLDRYTV
jgi:ribosomal protein S18 acetylase RimI-like enzyme